MNLESHLWHISLSNQIPEKHIAYLESLRDTGFYPKVIYDIGACFLNWYKPVHCLWPEADIIVFDAFEPLEFLYKNKKYYIGLLTDSDNKPLKFYQNSLLPGGNSYYRENSNVFPPNQYIEKIGMTLDTIVRSKGFPLPDLVKIDVQGAELDIIKGGQKTFSNTKYLIIEAQHTNYNIGAPKADFVIPEIEKMGWKCIAYKFCDNGPDADYCFMRV